MDELPDDVLATYVLAPIVNSLAVSALSFDDDPDTAADAGVTLEGDAAASLCTYLGLTTVCKRYVRLLALALMADENRRHLPTKMWSASKASLTCNC